MAYVNPDFKTKKALKDALAGGAVLRPYNPGMGFPTEQNGLEFLEGPHYPAAHTWYATVEVLNGVIVKVK